MPVFMLRNALLACVLVLGATHPPGCKADEALVAVAANFLPAATHLVAAFEAHTGHRIQLTAGPTGHLYTQVVQGAPFDALLAADVERPQRLEQEGEAVAGSRFTYAIGKLVLWSADPEWLGADGAETVASGEFRALAMANPQVAPYGTAAESWLRQLGVYEQLNGKIVVGQSVGQAYSMAASGNAELGLVALSQVLGSKPGHGGHWPVPESAYEPIRQDAVLLGHGTDNPAARAFLDYLRGNEAKQLIARFGYDTE